MFCKNKRAIGIVLVLFMVGILPLLYAGGQEQKTIVEKVTVTNVEVPVRVLDKGKAVEGLTKDDFVLYENKKKMQINGFYTKRKLIKITQDAPQAQQAPKPRTFVLVFNVTSYNEEFQKAVNYLFDKVLKPTDNIMVFANDKTREYQNLRDKEGIKRQLIADMKEESQKARRRLLDYIKRVETYLQVNDFKRSLASRDSERPDRLISFLKKYLISWTEYKSNYLTPKADRFYYFSRYLQNLKTEKWVLNFYQFEFFPRIRLGSETMHKIRELASEMVNTNNATIVAQGRMMENLLSQLMSELNINKGFPNEEIAKLFYKVDATFHSFFIRSQNPGFLQDFEYKSVSSEVEKLLKSITDITGGENVTSIDLEKALDQVTEKEDLYYILTYVPKNPKKSGKLKIKVKGKKYNVLYDDNFRADYINEYFGQLEQKVATPDIKIKGFSFKDRNLKFTVVDYMIRKIPDQPKPIGQMQVRIRIVDAGNNVYFNSGKLLTATDPQMKINIPAGAFKKVPRGEFNLFIDAKDMFTGKEANFHQNVVVK